jgi:hypothetical protein
VHRALWVSLYAKTVSNTRPVSMLPCATWSPTSAKLCYVPPPIDQNNQCCLGIDRGVRLFCIRAPHIRVVEQSPCRTRFTCGPLWSAQCHARIGGCTKGDAPR